MADRDCAAVILLGAVIIDGHKVADLFLRVWELSVFALTGLSSTCGASFDYGNSAGGVSVGVLRIWRCCS